MDKKVADILGGMGVDMQGGKTASSIVAESEKQLFHPAIAGLLNQSGIKINEEEVMGGEGSPLNAPGSAPMYQGEPEGQDTNAQGTQSNVQLKDKGKGSQDGIQLNQNSGRIETIDDLAGKMTEISETMRLIDLTTQTLKANAKDSTLEAHKNRFRDDIEHLYDLIGKLREAVR